jgi:hypothetical protein
MTLKTFFLRFGGLIVIALAAGPLFAVTMNVMIYFQLFPESLVDKAFGNVLTMKAIYVWMGCLLAGFGSLFLKEQWRLILYFSPLFAPSIFAVIYTLLQH